MTRPRPVLRMGGLAAAVLLHGIAAVLYGMQPAAAPHSHAGPGVVFLSLQSQSPISRSAASQPQKIRLRMIKPDPGMPQISLAIGPPVAAPTPPALPSEAAAIPPPGPEDALQRYTAVLYGHLRAHRDGLAGQIGSVTLRFSLSPEGHLDRVMMVQSSGDLTVDRAARILLYRAEPFPPPPPGLTEAQRTFTLPLRFD